MNGVRTGLMFSLKANLHRNPYQVYFLLFICAFFFSTFSIRVFERELDFQKGQTIAFASYWNAAWCLVITILTVGYGDFYPSTDVGRMIAVFSAIFGIFLTSMLIVSVSNVLIFEGNEQNVFLLIDRVQMQSEKETIAKTVVTQYLRLFCLIKYKKISDEDKGNKVNDIMLNLHRFKKKAEEIEGTFPTYSENDCILENLEYLEFEIEALTEKNMLANNKSLYTFVNNIPKVSDFRGDSEGKTSSIRLNKALRDQLLQEHEPNKSLVKFRREIEMDMDLINEADEDEFNVNTANTNRSKKVPAAKQFTLNSNLPSVKVSKEEELFNKSTDVKEKKEQ